MRSFSGLLDRHTPSAWVTPGLIGLNCAVFIAMAFSGVDFFKPSIRSLLQWGADYAPKVSSGQWWRLFTSVFLHIGVFHLAMNMIVLWSIGRFVEKLLGNLGFLVVYFILGLAGSVASVWWHPSMVGAGASGAIFGLYGYLLGFLLRNRRSIASEELQKLMRGALIFLGYNLLFGAAAKGIDLAAHLGGLLAGVAVGLAAAQPLTESGVNRRIRSALTACAGALAILVAAVAFMPKAADLMTEYTHFDEVEAKELGLYNGTVEKAHKGQIDDAGFASVLEFQILPEWDSLRAHLQDLQGVPKDRAEFHARLCAYMQAQEEGWALLDAALKSGDLAKAGEARKKQSEADERYRALLSKE